MSKVLTMLVALALFGAVPAVAGAQQTDPYEPGTQPGAGGNVSSGNTQTGNIDQDGAANQACLIQQNAGRDANAACSQEQNVGTGNAGTEGTGVRSTGVTGTQGVGTSGVTGTSGGVGGGSVQSVSLARTGFDAWVLALLGGVSVAGGLGLLAAQRRGRLSA